MENLATAIKKRFTIPKEFGLERFIISCSDEVGEGEHKIFEYIREEPIYHKETNTVIYGLDADLIMLTLNHLYISDNLYLFRETPEFIKSIDNTLNPNELYLLDIPEFGKSIIQEFSNASVSVETELIASIENKNYKSLINDYIFLFFFLGNDFLPHFPALNIRTNGIDLLMNAYKMMLNTKKLSLTSDGHIIWKNVRILIDYLSKHELAYITKEYVNRAKFRNNNNYNNKTNTLENNINQLPSTDRIVEQYINPSETGWEVRYYRALFDIQITDEKRKEICINYLEGLEWTFKYYRAGCVDWRWTYKYDYPPLLVDLIKYIPYFDTDLLKVTEPTPVTPMVQLAYVLPKASLGLIPNAIGAHLLQSKPEWYTDKCEFQWAFCKYFWESHVKLPDIAIEELETLIA
jgi:5'-3' exonuclease